MMAAGQAAAATRQLRCEIFSSQYTDIQTVGQYTDIHPITMD